ncbi:MAG TPA: hypothetical protein ENJ95_00695 [Bacteroidetes bacterium]|nr:hypothetical protein [Bacteroidota bacterium]
MILYFLIAMLLSFIGSLPFGMINMAVAHTAIQKGVRSGVWMGIGAAIVEFFQVFISLKFTWLFEKGTRLGEIFQIIALIVFFIAGIYFFFFAKAKSKKIKDKSGSSRRNEFFKGMFISSLNLVVFPYWIFYGTLLTANDLLERSDACVAIFSLGAMTGAFGLLVAYAYLGAKILSKSEQVTKWVNKFIGAVLMGFGIYQLIQWLNG